MVVRVRGARKPLLCNAAKTRSPDSFTAASGQSHEENLRIARFAGVDLDVDQRRIDALKGRRRARGKHGAARTYFS